MTTNPVVTVTDKLLEELESAAKARFNLKSGQCEGGFSLKGDVCSKCGNGPKDLCGMPLPEPYTAPVTILALLNHIRAMQQELKAAHISVDNCELFRKDAERLDWMIEEGCVVYSMNGTSSPTVYQVTWPRLGEHQREWYPSEREAIDAAMAASHSS